LVTEAQLAEAELIQRREGGTLGESLIRMGALDEEQLVDFFHRRLLVPRLDPDRFAAVQKAALVTVPADMAAEFGVFPVEIDADGTLTLAMADPSDAGAADEVGFFTERFCQRAVAPPSLIRAAIQHYYGVAGGGHKASRHAQLPVAVPFSPLPEQVEAPQRRERDEPTPLPPARPLSSHLEDVPAARARRGEPAAEPYAQLVVESQYPPRPDDTPPMDPPAGPASSSSAPPGPGQEPRTPGRPVARLDRSREAAADGGASTTGGASARPPGPGAPAKGEGAGPPRRVAPPPIPADAPPRAVSNRTPPGSSESEYPDPPLATLRAVNTREDIARALLHYMAQMAPRAALFVVRRKMLVGYDGKGVPLDLRALRQLRFPMQAPSLFRDVIQSRLPYRGSMENTPVFSVLTGFLGELPGDIILFPISVREKVVAVLYADGLTKPVPDAILLAVVREAGRAYERIILESKR
jgi:hypothetical protein